MKTVAICSPRIKEIIEDAVIGDFLLHKTSITIGLIDVPDPNYTNLLTSKSILVKVKAFSCNYRDKSLMLMFNDNCKKMSKHKSFFYSPFGSEFVGEVIYIGENVTNLKIGDRVIPEMSYPLHESKNLGGVPTNHASQRILLFEEEQVIKIPDIIPDEIAAGFSVAAQTTYSMVRKLQLKTNENILITSGSSSTSLAILNILKNMDINIYVTSTNESYIDDFLARGAKGFIPHSNWNNKSINVKFDAIVDPFFDINMKKVLPYMSDGSRFVTCGYYSQHPSFNKIENKLDFKEIMKNCILKNLVLIGNCLGTKVDLETALSDYCIKKFDIPIDSVYTGNEFIPFLKKSFSIIPKFGKVIYVYTD